MTAKKREPIPDIVYSGHRPTSPGPPRRKPAYDTISDRILAAHVDMLQSRIDRAIKAFSINPIRDSKDWAELERDVLEILEGKQ